VFPENQRLSVAVSSPGGAARQFRVQYFDAPTGQWQMFATFRSPDLAQSCLDDLIRTGLQARLINYRICPVAG